MLVISVFVLLSYVRADKNDKVANHSAWKMLSEFECGISAADRIIGGVNAALGQFPWIVRLGYSSPFDDKIDWVCGGVLVTDSHVVTAAHCVQEYEDGFNLSTLRFGEHNTRTEIDCQMNVCAPPIQDRGIKHIKSHPDFNNPSFHNDIAIIETDSPVEIHDYVSPICLPDDSIESVIIGDMATTAGWGKMNMSTDARAEILQVVTLPIVKPETCNSFGKGFHLDASETLCAGAQLNKDACGGDSGGPLMKVFDTPEGPKNFLIGVVSFGPTICGIRKPGVYASVSYFLEWILDNIV